MARHINKFSKQFTKADRAAQRKTLIAHHQQGEGLYRFKNRNKATDGRKVVGPHEEWEGDNYFLKMVPREAYLVRVIQVPKTQEQIMAEQKLILDQPDMITEHGKVEHVIADPSVRPIVEQKPAEKDKLLTEDPMSGITILRD